VIVLDASVLIAHLDERDAQHERAADVLLASADHPLGASAITLAEVLVGPARHERLETAEAALRTLVVDPIPLGDDAPARLARLRATTGLRLPDCCVIKAAQDVGASSILTFDDRLAREAAALGFR
jgi:predicted nucleic acid-binding protein